MPADVQNMTNPAGGEFRGAGFSGTLKVETFTVEVAQTATTASLYTIGTLPSRARIRGASKVSWDNLDAGTASLDVGVYDPQDSGNDDPDALSNGHDISSAGSGNLIAEIADYGKELWEHSAGFSADPDRPLTIKASIEDETADGQGTITAEVYYTVD